MLGVSFVCIVCNIGLTHFYVLVSLILHGFVALTDLPERGSGGHAEPKMPTCPRQGECLICRRRSGDNKVSRPTVTLTTIKRLAKISGGTFVFVLFFSLM